MLVLKHMIFKLFISNFALATLLIATELPIGFTQEEWNNRHLILNMGRETEPPEGPVRSIAEYEPMQGVLIRYPFGINTSLIKEISSDEIVYCLVSSSLQNAAFNTMNNAQVNMDNVEFIIGPTDSYWTRDYGPWWAVDANGDAVIIDFTYNRPRINDNQAPLKVSSHLDVPYYSADFISTGGNYMTDGYGASASSHIAYTENDECLTNDDSSVPLSPCNYVDEKMLNYYGVNNYHVIADPNNDYIDHIDCWAKFLSSSKILIRQVPPNHPQYNKIEQIVDYFAENTSYEIIRVNTPNNEPYTNSLILNNKVFIPVMNSINDSDAIEVYESALPGYEILPFTGTWESTDALHCRIKGIPDLSFFSINPGDLNIDNIINILDIVLCVNFVLGEEIPTSVQFNNADMNSDETLNVLDVILIVNEVIE